MSQSFAMLFVEPYQVLYRGSQILMVKQKQEFYVQYWRTFQL
jgi:hypothetical protein